MPVVTSIRELETCLDSSRVVQFELDCAIDEPCMVRTAEHGRLAYYPEFPRPYFCVRRSGWYVVQGILGDSWLRVTFLPDANPQAQAFLVAAVAGSATSLAEVESEEVRSPSGCYPVPAVCDGRGQRR